MGINIAQSLKSMFKIMGMGNTVQYVKSMGNDRIVNEYSPICKIK